MSNSSGKSTYTFLIYKTFCLFFHEKHRKKPDTGKFLRSDSRPAAHVSARHLLPAACLHPAAFFLLFLQQKEPATKEIKTDRKSVV